MYINMMPATTIKPNTISPILPLRLSSFISQTRKPTSGSRKIRKKIILGVLSILKRCVMLSGKDIKIKNAYAPVGRHPAQRNPVSNICSNPQLLSYLHYQYNTEIEE